MKEQFPKNKNKEIYEAVADEIDNYILMKLRDYRIADSVGFIFEALSEMAKVSAIMREKAKRS